MSQFKDSFTKDSPGNLLDYDDSASIFFFTTLLIICIIYMSYILFYKLICTPNYALQKVKPLKNDKFKNVHYCSCEPCQQRFTKLQSSFLRSKWNSVLIFQIALTIVLWMLFFKAHSAIKQIQPIQSFDPYEILQISESSTVQQIRKAYRAMSLKYHPDKNTVDPAAAAKFMLITKAYETLSDPASKERYEKYGNPDGPEAMKVGIGLPSFLVDENLQVLNLCIFFIILLLIIPVAFLLYYQRQRRYSPNGINTETLSNLGYSLKVATRFRNCPDLLAMSQESKELPMHSSDEIIIQKLIAQMPSVPKCKYTENHAMRTYYLIWAHLARKHDFLSPTLLDNLNQILIFSEKILDSIIQIAIYHEWICAAESIIEFRRCMIQGLDQNDLGLLQIPFFDLNAIQHCLKGKKATISLAHFMKQDPKDRKGLTDLSLEQKDQVATFLSHLPDLQLSVTIVVEDEASIVMNDAVTCKIKGVRKQLKDNECAGPVHAPLFPILKSENWWFIVIHKRTNKTIGMHQSTTDEKTFEIPIVFHASQPGLNTLEIRALCDSYKDFDQKLEVSFEVLTNQEMKRPIVVHPEDLELDNEPSMIEYLMGGGEADESDSDDSPEAPQSSENS